MYKHVVVWQFKDGTEKKARAFLKELEGLKGVIECLRSIQTGYNENDKEGATGVLICEFDTMEDLNSYANDPRHLKVAAKCKPIRTSRVACDFKE
jgi:hypothetical protein